MIYGEKLPAEGDNMFKPFYSDAHEKHRRRQPIPSLE